MRRVGVGDRVIFTHFVPDVELPTAYAASDVFRNAGIAESQSIATMEAMAAGKPVVAADAVALPDLVHHGWNGYTFAPGNIAALAEHLAELLTNTRKREMMGQRSLEIIACPDLRNTLVAYEQQYYDALWAGRER